MPALSMITVEAGCVAGERRLADCPGPELGVGQGDPRRSVVFRAKVHQVRLPVRPDDGLGRHPESSHRFVQDRFRLVGPAFEACDIAASWAVFAVPMARSTRLGDMRSSHSVGH